MKCMTRESCHTLLHDHAGWLTARGILQDSNRHEGKGRPSHNTVWTSNGKSIASLNHQHFNLNENDNDLANN